jgi:hypothetical protein
MPRSRINGKFIDKTSSIVANILLQIIPTTSGEKRAFTNYRVPFDYFFSPTYISFLQERERVRIERTKLVKETRAWGR